jgi:hypothetical protein
MCVIIACESKRPTLKMLKDAQKANPNGSGIAWVKDGKVNFIKGLGLKVKDIFEITEKLPFPFVIHFRIASSGEVSDALCHPFLIQRDAPLTLHGKAKAVLFHNGTWSEWQKYTMETACRSLMPVPNGNWNDTRAMAWMAAILGYGILDIIDEKTVVLTKDGLSFSGEGWVDRKGIWCSNDLFEDRFPIYSYAKGNYASMAQPEVEEYDSATYRHVTRKIKGKKKSFWKNDLDIPYKDPEKHDEELESAIPGVIRRMVNG